MQAKFKFLLTSLPLAVLGACGGGGDLADRLDVADPVVRFVDAAPGSNVTLFRDAAAQSDATNVAYKYASNYFDISTGAANWSVKSADGTVTLGSQAIDPLRGNRYTIVALPSMPPTNGTYLINDPYNKPLTSQSTHLRLMNAAANAPSVDVYMNAVGTDISTINPLIPATAYRTSGPLSGNDSVDIPGGTYQLRITSVGTKTVLFGGTITFGNNQDILLLAVPDPALPARVKALVTISGSANKEATEIASTVP